MFKLCDWRERVKQVPNNLKWGEGRKVSSFKEKHRTRYTLSDTHKKNQQQKKSPKPSYDVLFVSLQKEVMKKAADQNLRKHSPKASPNFSSRVQKSSKTDSSALQSAPEACSEHQENTQPYTLSTEAL